MANKNKNCRELDEETQDKIIYNLRVNPMTAGKQPAQDRLKRLQGQLKKLDGRKSVKETNKKLSASSSSIGDVPTPTDQSNTVALKLQNSAVNTTPSQDRTSKSIFDRVGTYLFPDKSKPVAAPSVGVATSNITFKTNCCSPADKLNTAQPKRKITWENSETQLDADNKLSKPERFRNYLFPDQYKPAVTTSAGDATLSSSFKTNGYRPADKLSTAQPKWKDTWENSETSFLKLKGPGSNANQRLVVLRETLQQQQQEQPHGCSTLRSPFRPDPASNVAKNCERWYHRTGLQQDQQRTEPINNINETLMRKEPQVIAQSAAAEPEDVAAPSWRQLQQLRQAQRQECRRQQRRLRGPHRAQHAVLRSARATEPATQPMDWEDFDDDDTFAPSSLNSSLQSAPSKDHMYFVLDTNVLIHNLPIVEVLAQVVLSDSETTGSMLYIPYIVIKELNNLKTKRTNNNEQVRRMAVRAIHFLNAKFDKSLNIDAQSAIEEARHLIEVDCGDDSIVNCCLQLKGQVKHMMLLTNDANLRLKANASNIKASNCVDLQSAYPKEFATVQP